MPSVGALYHHKQHLETMLGLKRVWHIGWHRNDLTCFYHNFFATYGDSCFAVQNVDECVSCGSVGAQSFPLIKCEQGEANGLGLGKSTAHHTAFLVIHKIR